jgi:hypothetical protein
MKKLLLALTICSVIYSSQAQEAASTDDTIKNFNELKVNALYLVIGAAEVTYERTINEESALGLSLFVPFDEDVFDDFNFYASPYYRLYFGNKYASGFFVEGFGLLSSYDTRSVTFGEFDTVVEEDSQLAFALGIGVGGKWVTKSGFIAELGLGIGRNIVNADDFIDDLVGKVNISVGYRF